MFKFCLCMYMNILFLLVYICTVYPRVLVEEFIPKQNTTQTICLIDEQHLKGRKLRSEKNLRRWTDGRNGQVLSDNVNF